MGRSSQLVTEDSDLEEGKPGRQTHHMGQHGFRLNEPQIHAMSLSNYEAPAREITEDLGRSNSRHRLSCEVRFAALNVGTMTGKRVEEVELMKRR